MRFPRTPALVIALAASTWAQAARPLEDIAARAGDSISWFEADRRLIEEGRNRNEVQRSERELAGYDREAAMDRALEEARKQGSLVLWYVPRILASSFRTQGAQMYRPALLDGYVRATFFTDPDVADLVNRQFVPVRIVVDQALGKRFQIQAPEAVEPAFFILDGEGEVLRRIDRIRSFNTAWFYSVLLGELEKRPALHAKPDGGESGSIADRARDLRRSGHSVPAEWVDEPSNPADRVSLQIERARALRLRSDLAEAHAALSDAEEHLEGIRDRNARATAAAEIAVERGRLKLLSGAHREAALEFMKVRRGPVAEARFHQGLCAFLDRNDTFAARHWREATLADPESPWAVRAAVNLVDGNDRTPIGPAVHGFEDPFLPPAGLAAGAGNTSHPGGEDRAMDAVKASFEYLLRMQRENGGWTDSRYAYWPTPDITPNVWVATTALACTALLEWRSLNPEAVDEALQLGERYMLHERYMARGFQEEIYAEAYKLFYLAGKHGRLESGADSRACIERMNAVVKRIQELQGTPESRAPGFWGHEYPNPFTTAAVMNALVRARERGALVPKALLARGADALLTVRSDTGAFGYSAGRIPGGDRENQRKDSSGRSAICEAAILWAGHERGDAAVVEEAVEMFWTHLPRLEKVRLCDFHTDGELGGFFFWHAVFHTIESFEALPAESRAAHRTRMRGFLVRLGELDGSFLDSHEIGKSYGTAMALLALRRVMDGGP